MMDDKEGATIKKSLHWCFECGMDFTDGGTYHMREAGWFVADTHVSVKGYDVKVSPAMCPDCRQEK